VSFKNKEHYDKWSKERIKKNTAAIQKLKEETPCFDCKNKFPHYIMQFDHVPERGLKLFSIAVKAGNRTIQAPTMARELAKCDILCANCHSIRTYKRRQNESK